MAKRTRWAWPPERRSVLPAQERTDIRPLDDLVKRRWPPVEPPDQAEGLVDADAGREADARAGLEHGTDSAVGHRLAWVAAENLDATFLRSDETEQRRDGGRLAGPVRSEQRKHLTLEHVQVQSVEGNPRSVAVGDALEGQRDWAWRRQGECVGWCCYKGRQGGSPAAQAQSCGGRRSVASPQPWRRPATKVRRTLATLRFETLAASCFSSPTIRR